MLYNGTILDNRTLIINNRGVKVMRNYKLLKIHTCLFFAISSNDRNENTFSSTSFGRLTIFNVYDMLSPKDYFRQYCFYIPSFVDNNVTKYSNRKRAINSCTYVHAQCVTLFHYGTFSSILSHNKWSNAVSDTLTNINLQYKTLYNKNQKNFTRMKNFTL